MYNTQLIGYALLGDTLNLSLKIDPPTRIFTPSQRDPDAETHLLEIHPRLNAFLQ